MSKFRGGLKQKKNLAIAVFQLKPRGGKKRAATVYKVEIARWPHLCKRFPWAVVEVAMGGDTHTHTQETEVT